MYLHSAQYLHILQDSKRYLTNPTVQVQPQLIIDYSPDYTFCLLITDMCMLQWICVIREYAYSLKFSVNTRIL